MMPLSTGPIPTVEYNKFVGRAKCDTSRQVYEHLEKLVPRSQLKSILFHYTCAAQAILESEEIRLTESRYLNDAAEFQYGWQLFRNALRTRSDYTGPTLRPLIEKFESDLAAVFPSVRCYIFSMSEHNEMDAQWRRYARDRHGASMSFDLKFWVGAESPGAKQHFRLLKCCYSAEEQVRRSNEAAECVVHAISSIANSDAAPELRRALKFELLLQAIESAATIAATLKSPGWEQEREWRLVRIDFNRAEDVFEGQRANGNLMEYVVARPRYTSGPDKGRLPVDWITTRSSPIRDSIPAQQLGNIVVAKGYRYLPVMQSTSYVTRETCTS